MNSSVGRAAAGVLLAVSASVSDGGAALSVYTSRSAFSSNAVVHHAEDFEGFFGSNPDDWSAANFGDSSLTFFLPIVYSASSGGSAALFETAYHSGPDAAAVIDGPPAVGTVTFGASYSALGIDLLRANFSSPAASYRISVFRSGGPVGESVVAPADSFLGITAPVEFDSVRIEAVGETGGPARETFDNIVLGIAGSACNRADVAEPFGLLDLADIAAFVTGFQDGAPFADPAVPAGVFDLADITEFVSAFTAGCP